MFHARTAGRRVLAAVRPLRLLVGISAVAVIVASVSTAVAATTVTLKPVADTWVNTAAPAVNYGTSTALRIDGSPVWNAYVRFDLRSTAGTVTGAVLKLHANSASTAGLSVHRVTATTWNEATLKAANAPAMGATAVKSGPLSAGSTVSVNVTSLVTAGSLVTLGLTDNDGTAISLASRESAYPPTLVLTVSASNVTPPPAATATPRPVGTGPAPTAATTPAPTASTTPVPTASTTPVSGGPPTSANPMRATFYYPWFPLAWNQSGMNPFTHYHPSAGFYNGASSAVVAGQIQAMQYGKISMGIASWWGQGDQTDAKMPMLLSTAAGTGFKWSIYYEPEGTTDPSASQIGSDLAYINSHYGSNPSFYRINGKPVIFVYAQPADGCGMVSRWAQGNASHADYVVLKVFPGFANCAGQPDQWHQYSPAVAEDHQAGRAFAISPGFWLATGPVRLGRDLTRWQQEVRDMVASHEPWQLVTTFNEWGEGTAVESATEWSSSSGYGTYLDALHNS